MTDVATPGSYLDDPVAREEGGTPAIVESIRAGLVFGLKQAIGTDLIAAREEQLWQRVLRRWEGNPRIEILGSHQASMAPKIKAWMTNKPAHAAVNVRA